MLGLVLSLAFSAFAFQAPVLSGPTSFDPASFTSSINHYYDHPGSLPPAVKKKLSAFDYVFVAGFLSEVIPGYFKDNVQFLVDQGVPVSRIKKVFPPSKNDVLTNADVILRSVTEHRDRSARKVVILAHSKGALEALTFALRDPKVFLDHVEALFLLQGPLGGSPVADYISGVGVPVDSKMPQPYRALFENIDKVGGWTSCWTGNGLSALVRSTAKAGLTDLLEDLQKDETNAADIRKMSDRIFYIQSRKNPRDMTFAVRAAGWYLETYYGENDGLVLTADQVFSGVGTSLTILRADHADLTNPTPVARTPKALREALMSAIAHGLVP